jgi:RecB family exonuclease
MKKERITLRHIWVNMVTKEDVLRAIADIRQDLLKEIKSLDSKIDGVEKRLSGRIDRVERNLTNQIDAIDTRLDAVEIEYLPQRVSRIEKHLHLPALAKK